MREVVYRPRATADLSAIADYTKTEHGEGQAKRYLAEIRKQIGLVAELPGIGTAVHGLPTGYRKIGSGLHRVIYRHTENELIVIRILHAKQDMPDEITDF